MTEFILSALIFMCGWFLGFAMAAVFAVGGRHEDEFDGGYSAQNPPPVRTTIQNGSVNEGKDQ